jgi:hypothetical protein
MNDVYVHQFTTTGDVIVFDEFGQAGFIHVVNRSDVLYVRNPAFDRTLTFRMNIRSQVSNLVLTIFEPNVTVAFNGDKETALSIRNNDNIGALRLTVNDSLGWTFFPQNTITLNPAEERVLIYRIRPRITATGQTNQTHVLTITAQGENTVAVTRTVSVFVPFQNLTGTSVENLNLTREQLQAELEAAIARFTALRDSLAGGTNATSIIFLERNQTLALTGEQLNALALALPSLKESVDRLLGDRQTVIENVNSQIAQANTNSATALELTKTLESALKNMQSWRAFTIVLGSVLLLEGGLLYGIWHYRRRSTKEKLVKL